MTGLSYGTIVDNKYKVLEPLGKGGMGEVYKVEHITLNKPMALKLLPSDNFSDEMWRRFKKEVHAASTLDHANLVKVYDFGLLPDKTPFYTMELVKGVSLSQMIREHGPLNTQQCLSIFIPVCFALQYVHEHQFVHRDIKPGNIMINEEANGRILDIKVLDFGIAKKVGHGNTETNSLTKPGEIVGSPFYMSPEQAEGRPVDARSDIYSLGCSIYHALTGSPPYRAKNAVSLAMMHTNSSIPSLVENNPSIPEDLDYVVSITLGKEPEDRYQSMKDLVRDLIAVKAGNRPPSLKDGFPKKKSTTTQNKGKISQQAFQNLENFEDSNTELRDLDETGDTLLSRKNIFIAGLAAALLLVGSFTAFFVFAPPQTGRTDDPNGQTNHSFSHITGRDDRETLEHKLLYGTELKDQEGPDLTSQQQAEKIAGLTTPFSHTGTIGDGTRVRQFDFPKDNSYGTIYSSDRSQSVDCKGLVTLPIDGQFVFKPSRLFIKTPALFTRFKPDELEEIDFSESQAVGDSQLLCCRNMRKIKRLNLNATDVSAASLPALNNMPELTELRACDTKLKGADLAKLKRLLNLETLEARQLDDVSSLVKALRSSHNIRVLKLSETLLQDNDLIYIGQMRSLLDLSIGNNPSITTRGLNYLTNLQNLSSLSIYGIKLQPSCIEALSRLKNLHALKMGECNWPPSTLNELARRLPRHCKIQIANL